MFSGEIDVEYLEGHAYLVFFDFSAPKQTQGPWVVPPDEVFTLGDNRNWAFDSRVWFGGRGGGVPFEKLIGTPKLVWLAFDISGAIDWQRLGESLDEPQLTRATSSLEIPLRSCLQHRPSVAESTPPSKPGTP
jgi:signal peptidase I